MKRLFLTELLIITLLSSCASSGDLSHLAEASFLSPQEASIVYESYLERNEDEKVRWNYTLSLYEAKDYERALTETEKALSLYEDNIRFPYLKALILRDTGDYEGELDTLEDVKGRNPGNLDVRERLLSLYVSLDMATEAEEEAWDILSFDSRNKAAITHLSNDSDFFASLLKEYYPEKEEDTEE